jgi:NADPH2 dehydrogenase
MHAFTELVIKDLTLKNRLMMSPMCQYSSDATGQVTDFHLVHYASRAVGGVGLIMVEATAVSPNGRLSDEDLGLWSDEQVPGYARLVQTIHESGAAAGIQLAHGGRKADSSVRPTVAPSAFAFSDDYPVPHELSPVEIADLTGAFAAAAQRALQAGFDVVELHGAHGYLLHSFLSPLSNRRTDTYGGDDANRMRFLRETALAVRSVWPASKPLFLRLSATDYLPGGLTVADTGRVAGQLKDLVDVFDISSGGLLPAPQLKPFPGYQVPLAEYVKTNCHVPTVAVGLISTLPQIEDILGNRRADLVALGRELLRNPYWPIRQSLTRPIDGLIIPEPYSRAWT